MCARRVGACATLLLLLLLDLATADFDKRTDLSPMPFVMGSRYGRSSPPKLIAPRNDRFFMGSRYGKRSEGAAGGGSGEGAALAGGGGLVCEFTGVVPLYRCVRHNKRDHYDACGLFFICFVLYTYIHSDAWTLLSKMTMDPRVEDESF